jgi:tRNA (adenine57-N1/adenine58-N1)-methyltransferase
MLLHKEIIQFGDTVIVYSNPTDMKPVIITENGIFNNRHGKFPHDDMVGKPFGSKVANTAKKGFVHLLFPTPELWTLSLPHRTQILYMPDISMITMMLGITPGSIVLESGTGSGSFSHSMARTIYPEGRLYSFEYHQTRAETAIEEFKLHGLDEIITVEHRDVCKDGFGLENLVSAVFLDLPSPWEALESAYTAFSNDKAGRICCFSPCIEQVHLTCDALKRLGFTGASF